MKNEKELQEKILKGVQLAIDKMLLVRKQNDDYVVISQNGKIVRIKARELK